MVDQGGTTDLTWSDTGMDDCVAGSNPTNPSWTSGVNPDPAGGVKTNIGIATTTDFTLSCEDTALGSILSDTVTVYLRGFSIDANLRDIWGIQLPGSVTTQSRVAIDPTPNFTDNIQLAASSDSGLADDVTLQFLDDGGNSLGASTLLSPSQFDDGVWLQARVDGMDVPFGETPINITATAANGSTTDQIRIYLHLRGVWEL